MAGLWEAYRLEANIGDFTGVPALDSFGSCRSDCDVLTHKVPQSSTSEQFKWVADRLAFWDGGERAREREERDRKGRMGTVRMLSGCGQGSIRAFISGTFPAQALFFTRVAAILCSGEGGLGRQEDSYQSRRERTNHITKSTEGRNNIAKNGRMT